MGSFVRLLPYVLPHRRLFIVSAIFGLGVALLWGTNLSVAFPVVKVLLQGQSLQEYADQEADWYGDEIAATTSELDSLPDRKLKERARLQGKIAEKTSKLTRLNWARKRLLPHLPRDAFDTMALVLGLLVVGTLLKGIGIFIQDVLIGSAVEKSCHERNK